MRKLPVAFASVEPTSFPESGLSVPWNASGDCNLVIVKPLNLHVRSPLVSDHLAQATIYAPKFLSDITTVGTSCKGPGPLFWITALEFSIVFILLFIAQKSDHLKHGLIFIFVVCRNVMYC